MRLTRYGKFAIATALLAGAFTAAGAYATRACGTSSAWFCGLI